MAERRDAKLASIVDTAWELARAHGIGGVTLHALAREVGMRQPSLYAYFDSKNALFDAMFADGNRRLLERLEALALPRSPRAAVKVFMRAFVTFASHHWANRVATWTLTVPVAMPTTLPSLVSDELLANE